jgi:hypothetical protein
VSERLIHYSHEKLGKIWTVRQVNVDHSWKPSGLWVSVEGDDDWPAFCHSGNFRLERLRSANEIVLADDANILRIASPHELDLFTEAYGEGQYKFVRTSSGIDWLTVSKKFQGIIIAPYLWSRRMTAHTRWYYGWDCASGCIWDAAAVLRLRSPETGELRSGPLEPASR